MEVQRVFPEVAAPAAPRSSSRGPITAPPGGFDTVEIAVYGQWRSGQWERTREALERAKHAAELETGGEVPAHIRGELVLMRAGGSKHGAYCRYSLRIHGCDVAICDKALYLEGRISVFVRLSSVALMGRGLLGAWEDVQAVLSAWGFVSMQERVSRADLCVDVVGLEAHELCQRGIDGGLVCRAKGDKHLVLNRSNRWGSMRVGASDIVLRVYDKLAELGEEGQSMEKDAKRSFLIFRWGTVDPSAVTRVEYQVRGKALRQHFGVETVAQLHLKGGHIAGYLTGEWSRFHDANVNRDRTATAPVWDVWKGIQCLFADAFGDLGRRGERKSTRVIQRSRRKLVEGLAAQAIGCLLSAAALLGLSKGELCNAGDYAKVLRTIEHAVSHDAALARAELWMARGGLEFGG